MLLIGIIVGLLALTVIITLHELGHFWAARRGGVVVEEFGIGMPPKAWAKKVYRFSDVFRRQPKARKQGQQPFIFSLNWLPIGGFCRMKGESSQDTSKGSFGAASFKAKSLIMFAGVLMNLATAALIFTILMWTGMPRLLPNQLTMPGDTHFTTSPVTVTRVLEGSPAAAIGLQAGDEIISVAGEAVSNAALLPEITASHQGETVELLARTPGRPCVTPVGESCRFEVTLTDGSTGQGYLGLSGASEEKIRATWSAPLIGIGLTGQLTVETVKGIGTIFRNLGAGIAHQVNPATREEGRAEISAAGDGVTGPVGIIGVLFPSAAAGGPAMIALIVAIISLSLAVMNLLPIPALDGGRWLLLLIGKLRGQPISEEKEQKIIGYSFMAILALGIGIIILDIVRFF